VTCCVWTEERPDPASYVQTILAATTERQGWREQYAAEKLWTLFQQPAQRHPGKASTQVFLRLAIRYDAGSELVRGVAGRPVAGGPRSPEPPTQVESLYGGVMSKFRLAVCTGFAASALLLIPAGSASAHVHLITPLNCIEQVPDDAGADQTNGTPASAANGGPISGVIPITMGGDIDFGEGGADAAVCDGVEISE
jgi:hypothetical protein